MPKNHRDIFADQAAFMRAMGQQPGKLNAEQAVLYLKLVDEEVKETRVAMRKLVRALTRKRGPITRAELVALVAEVADGGIDTIYVATGLLHSLGLPAPAALWEEVQRSNMAKRDPKTGKVRKREDGKVLKPAGWTPPNLERKVEVQLAT